MGIKVHAYTEAESPDRWRKVEGLEVETYGIVNDI
jgi:hypothetical protein